MKRYLFDAIQTDIEKKMIFLWWPRQVGKTTLARMVWASMYGNAVTYLNRDNIDDKKRIVRASYDTGSKLIIFDEIHKFDWWKNFIKWEYDTKKDTYNFLVTGSSRLNVYQKWGDSLLGRYFYFRLHPYSYAECIKNWEKESDILAMLLQFWWFPEAYHARNERDRRRWIRDRTTKIVREDIRDLTNIEQIWKLELYVSLIESKVGSPFSIASCTWDVWVTHKTLSHRTDILEYMYYLRRIYPLQSTRIKSLRKEPKLYLRDRSEVENIWSRIENMIGSHLLKRVHFQQDVFWHEIELHYLKDQEWREVDFALTNKGIVTHCIEVKKSDTTPSPHLHYFVKKLQPEHAIQVVYNLDPSYDRITNGIRVVWAQKFLSELV
jgi:predicted AAA+ superfamily ATPase